MFLQNGKIHVGYKDLMENYQIVVSNLAAERGEKDTNLVLNVFQSLLDEFTRSYNKTDFERAKVGSSTPISLPLDPPCATAAYASPMFPDPALPI